MFDKNNSMTQGEEIDNIVYDGIGFNGIRYIQQSGEKVQGKIYLDKTQPGLWYCLKTNTSINNTSDFTRADSVALLDKLQNLEVFRYTINADTDKIYANLTCIIHRINKCCMIYVAGTFSNKIIGGEYISEPFIPVRFRPFGQVRTVLLGANKSSIHTEIDIAVDGTVRFKYSDITIPNRYCQFDTSYFTN